MLTLQDFSVVSTWVSKVKDENELIKVSDAFCFFSLDRILDLQDDEIADSITDSSYLQSQGESGGFDRGIDAVYIEDEGRITVHLFNCKYTEKYNIARDGNFPSGEIDKISGYLHALMTQEYSTIDSSNSALKDKTYEIWNIFQKKTPNFVLHICANYSNGLQHDERIRLEQVVGRYSNFEIKYHLINEFVVMITGQKRQQIDAQFRANGKELFEKSDGDIRALIINIKANELVRMIMANDQVRQSLDADDYSLLYKDGIAEDAFYDNVRVYKTQKSQINKSIVKTAKSDDRNRFFYYNNGITITCKSFIYPKNVAFPIVILEGIQIVNGSQTLHALYEVAQSNPEVLADVELLCRIYELKDPSYSSRIAEYTNSQNPVTTRDIRSIDAIQEKLDSEFFAKGYFYERKKDQYIDKPKKQRLDANKVGQILMAFYNSMPSEAKNDKKIVFGEKYDMVFSDDINCEKVLLAYNLYLKIENMKKKYKKDLETMDSKLAETKAHLLYSTYYVLYTLSKIAKIHNKELKPSNELIIFDYYDIAVALIEKAVAKDKRLIIKKEKFSYGVFFKSTRLKGYIDEYISKLGTDLTIERIRNMR
jgi:hypothetical protein